VPVLSEYDMPGFSMCGQHVVSDREAGLYVEFFTGQTLVGFDVFFAGPGEHFLGQAGAGGRFVPAQGFKVVPYELLVEGGRRDAFCVAVCGPEA
jgi:hypothetical protein